MRLLIVVIFLAAVGLSVGVGTSSEIRPSRATQSDPGFLSSIPKEHLADASGVTLVRPSPGLETSKFISRERAEEAALKLWPGSTVLESELAVVTDAGAASHGPETLWVVSLRPPGGLAMFPDLGPTDGASRDSARKSWFFYQTVDPVTGVGLWSHSAGED